ncbi:hypothetical protein [Streptomyces sp. NPDC048639]|uniref:hypothetical protein n=1 Tax=Streptomyces sp. NPDC048639 TaxID=3365581 RepID=UPI00371A553E
MTRRINALATSLAAVAALALTGCTPEQGTPGVVIDREKRFLTVRTDSDTEERFRVTKKTARQCVRGARYPDCTR